MKSSTRETLGAAHATAGEMIGGNNPATPKGAPEMQFNLGAIVGVVEHGVEKVWPGIVTHVDGELHKIVKFSDAGSTILHDVLGVADLAAATDPKLDSTTSHVIIPIDEAPAVDDDPAELVDEPPAPAPTAAKKTAAKAAAK